MTGAVAVHSSSRFMRFEQLVELGGDRLTPSEGVERPFQQAAGPVSYRERHYGSPPQVWVIWVTFHTAPRRIGRLDRVRLLIHAALITGYAQTSHECRLAARKDAPQMLPQLHVVHTCAGSLCCHALSNETP
ncbi:hypothetical protein [Streptomyces gibsoniae]|uniref:Uncharacterized protein n=1 Tax=Streptomyces gibsoniae TaxID=3075529 RepID=A0ABU2U6Z0_9ACTN|nr:hypothetical protein [Streptomyces sp. DSM 41699]MDT0468971.1 hypothetical protein [Streptomyces sp. DSM 41699]